MKTHVQNQLNVKNSRDPSEHRRLDTQVSKETDLRLKLYHYSWSFSTAEDTSGTTHRSSQAMGFPVP